MEVHKATPPFTRLRRTLFRRSKRNPLFIVPCLILELVEFFTWALDDLFLLVFHRDELKRQYSASMVKAKETFHCKHAGDFLALIVAGATLCSASFFLSEAIRSVAGDIGLIDQPVIEHLAPDMNLRDAQRLA